MSADAHLSVIPGGGGSGCWVVLMAVYRVFALACLLFRSLTLSYVELGGSVPTALSKLYLLTNLDFSGNDLLQVSLSVIPAFPALR